MLPPCRGYVRPRLQTVLRELPAGHAAKDRGVMFVGRAAAAAPATASFAIHAKEAQEIIEAALSV